MLSSFRSARVGQSIKWSILVFACAAVLAPSVLAYPLGATTALTLGGTVLPPLQSAPLGGTLVASAVDKQPWTITSAAGTASGTLTSAVYMEPAGMGGTLDFMYQLTVTSGSDTIGRITMSSFAGFMTNVGYSTDVFGPFVAGTRIPDTADRTSDSVIGFNYNVPAGDVILNGQTTEVLIISTNAKNWIAGTASPHDGSGAIVPAFEPGTVPEPATMALLGGGLLALAGIRRYRR